MKISLLLLCILAACLIGQEVPEQPEQPVTANTPADSKPADAKPEEVKPADAKPVENKPEDAPGCSHCEEARGFWLGMSLNEMIIAIALLAQILERLLEILFVAFSAQNFKKKTLISAFFGTLLAAGLCYLTQAHVLLDKLPSINHWHEYGKIAAMGFVLYCCTQPLHRLLARKSSADLIKPELPKI